MQVLPETGRPAGGRASDERNVAGGSCDVLFASAVRLSSVSGVA
jgi:hypothetical protein